MHAATFAWVAPCFVRTVADGKYGDPQTDEFIFMLKSTTGKSDVPPALAEKIAALKPGDKVRLVWEHVYVSDENGARPERPVRVLESE